MPSYGPKHTAVLGLVGMVHAKCVRHLMCSKLACVGLGEVILVIGPEICGMIKFSLYSTFRDNPENK